MLKEAGALLEEASVRFDAALKLRKDYSNALVPCRSLTPCVHFDRCLTPTSRITGACR